MTQEEIRLKLSALRAERRSWERTAAEVSQSYGRQLKAIDRHRAKLDQRETKLHEQLAAL